MNRLDAMTTLLAVIDAGSLSAASRTQRVPLATISRRISDLEAHLGTILLVRTRNRLDLTDAGRAYAAAAKTILQQIEDAERNAAGEYIAPRGELVIAAPVAFGRLHVLPVLVQFLAAYPDIDGRLIQSDRNSNILEDHMDVALRIGPLPDSSLIAARIGEVRQVVCASPAYLAARGTPQSPADLAQHSCISFDALTAPRAWRFGSGAHSQAHDVHARLVVNTADAAIDAAIAALGITRVLSYQIAVPLAASTLVPVLASFAPLPVPVNLLYPGQNLLPLKLRAFLDFATPRLRARLAG